MILSKNNDLLELRGYDGEFVHPAFYVYRAGMDDWLSTFRIARKHDIVPVIMSTGRRAYFENQLARHGFTVINGQIPTPIISFWLNDFSRTAGLDHPTEIKWFNSQDGALYPDMIPFEANWTVSFWTQKQEDMYELEAQFQSSFNNGGIRWIEFRDKITNRRQLTPFFIENRTDGSNYEPAEKDQPLLRTDYALRSELHIPRPGADIPLISKVYINLNPGVITDPSNIMYLSGTIINGKKKENDGDLFGIISPGLIHFSGTVNQNQIDQEVVIENVLNI